MSRRFPNPGVRRFLEFATGFFNAFTVFPLLFILLAMPFLYKKTANARTRTSSFEPYLLGLACGFPFAALFVYFFFKH